MDASRTGGLRSGLVSSGEAAYSVTPHSCSVLNRSLHILIMICFGDLKGMKW